MSSEVNGLARERKFTDEQLFNATKKMIINDGYEAFTFSRLAAVLHVSRGSIYKYYENKDELISEFLMYEMNRFLHDFQGLDISRDFEEQVEQLIDFIFKHSNIHHVMEIIHQIPNNTTQRAKRNKLKLNEYHIEMYQRFQGFLDIGRSQQKLKKQLPDGIILGMIFQTIAIPNHFGIAQEIWITSIKEIICNGMIEK